MARNQVRPQAALSAVACSFSDPLTINWHEHHRSSENRVDDDN